MYSKLQILEIFHKFIPFNSNFQMIMRLKMRRARNTYFMFIFVYFCLFCLFFVSYFVYYLFLFIKAKICQTRQQTGPIRTVLPMGGLMKQLNNYIVKFRVMRVPPQVSRVRIIILFCLYPTCTIINQDFFLSYKYIFKNFHFWIC